MSQPRYDLAGTGSMVVDLICHTRRFIGEDEKVLLAGHAGEPVMRRLVGGVTLNHLGWASLFGLRTAIFGKIADDVEGRFLRAGMAALGIDEQLDLSGSASSFAHVYVDPDGGRAIYIARGATGELTASEIDARHRTVIESASLVSTEVSQVPLAAVRRVVELARAAGARTVVDVDVPLRDAVPGLGSEEDLVGILESASVIKASLAALEGLSSEKAPEPIAAELSRRFGTEAIVLTLGGEGAAVFTDGKFTRERAPSVEVMDTTGAGDAFLGGLLVGLSRGLDWGAALKLATSCGGACCERLGGFPDEPELCRERALALYQAAEGSSFAVTEPAARPAQNAAALRFLRVAGEEVARATEQTDLAAINAAADHIEQCEAAGGRVHVTGIGKPEHVARYAASLLASTGTPATFLHGTEATHGSVGQLRSGDVVIAISNSGETRELLASVEAARGLGASVVAVTARSDSSLGRAADCVLEAPVVDEGGPLGLAPRASILSQTLVLQVLSVELQARKDFSRADYHARHPHGTLGQLSKRN